MIIRIISPEGAKEEFELNQETIILGRGKNCDIVLADDHISRNHLEIKNFNDVVYIKDLTLSNWISYNDEKLPKELDVQYYDFAPLLLPGNYRVEIEVHRSDGEHNSKKIDILKEQLNPHTMAVNTRSSHLSDISGQQDEYENEGEKNKQKKKSKYSRARDKKNKNDIYVIGLIVLGALAYVIYEFNINSHQVAPVVLKPIQKVVPPKNLMEKQPSTTIPQAQVQPGESEITITSPHKCQSSFDSILCKFIYEKSTKNEGVITRGSKVYVFKDFMFQSIDLLGTLNDVKKFNNNENFYKAIAGYKVTQPTFLRTLEEKDYREIVVMLFTNTVTGPKIVKIFQLDITDYRKYNDTVYEESYSKLKNRDLSYFTEKLSNFVKEKKEI